MFVAATSADPMTDYATIRAELTAHSPALLEKTEHVFISKADDAVPERIVEITKLFKKKKIAALPLSMFDEASLDAARKILGGIVV